MSLNPARGATGLRGRGYRRGINGRLRLLLSSLVLSPSFLHALRNVKGKPESMHEDSKEAHRFDIEKAREHCVDCRFRQIRYLEEYNQHIEARLSKLYAPYRSHFDRDCEPLPPIYAQQAV